MASVVANFFYPDRSLGLGDCKNVLAVVVCKAEGKGGGPIWVCVLLCLPDVFLCWIGYKKKERRLFQRSLLPLKDLNLRPPD